MSQKFQQFRFARIEALNITRARLEERFKNGICSAAELEAVIAEQLTVEPTKQVPWRQSDMEKVACREGIRLAALEFYWEHRHDTRPAGVHSVHGQLTSGSAAEASRRQPCRRPAARRSR